MSSMSVQDLNVDRRETRNASVFIPEDLLQLQGDGEGAHIECQLYIQHQLHRCTLSYCRSWLQVNPV